MLDLILVALQVIQVNATEPCLLNFTAGAEMWNNCGITDDYLQFIVLPWEWISGGNFSLVVVSLFVMFSYIKYHKMVYPMLIGLIFLASTAFIFPTPFLSYSFIFIGLGIAILGIYILLRQTKEYN